MKKPNKPNLYSPVEWKHVAIIADGQKKKIVTRLFMTDFGPMSVKSILGSRSTQPMEGLSLATALEVAGEMETELFSRNRRNTPKRR